MRNAHLEPSSDDAPDGPLRLVDAALEHYAVHRDVSSREIVDLLLDVRSAIVVDAALMSLREEFLGPTSGVRRGWLPRREPF